MHFIAGTSKGNKIFLISGGNIEASVLVVGCLLIVLLVGTMNRVDGRVQKGSS